MNSVLDTLAEPNHWDRVRFGHLVNRSREDGAPSLEPLSVFLDAGVVPRASRDDNFNRLGADMSKYLVVRPGDLVFNKLRTWQGGFGKSDYTGIVSPAYYVCRPQGGVDAGFLHYLLRSKPYLSELTRISKWMPPSQFDILWEDLRDVEVLLPPRPVQGRIRDFLDRETGRIDALVEKKRRLVDLLEEKRVALITHAVTKGLDPTVLMKESGIPWIGEIPAHWKVGRLKRFVVVARGAFSHRPRNDPAFYGGPHPFLQTGDIARAGRFITAHSQTLNEEGLRVSRLFPAGTIAMAIAANIGDVAELTYPACFPDSVVGFTPNQAVSSAWIYYYLVALKDQLLRSATLNTQLNTNLDRIGEQWMIVPPPSAQGRVVGYLDKAFGGVSALTLKLDEQSLLLAEYRQALITAAVTGDLEPSRFDGERRLEQSTA